MTEEQKKSLIKDIERSITMMARKNSVFNDGVIATIRELYIHGE